jgi:hypothetical protein
MKIASIKCPLAAFGGCANLSYFGNQSDIFPSFLFASKRTVLRAFQVEGMLNGARIGLILPQVIYPRIPGISTIEWMIGDHLTPLPRYPAGFQPPIAPQIYLVNTNLPQISTLILKFAQSRLRLAI